MTATRRKKKGGKKCRCAQCWKQRTRMSIIAQVWPDGDVIFCNNQCMKGWLKG